MKKLAISVILYFLAMSLFAPNVVINTEYFTKKYSSINQSFYSLSNNKIIKDTVSLKDFNILDETRKNNQSVIKLFKIEGKDVFANVRATFNAKHEFTIEDNFGPHLINDSKIFNQNSTRLIELN
jgi:hypothetical protein